MSDLTAFIAGLPKAELHVHHVGSASPRIVAELAARHPTDGPGRPEALKDYFTFTDFAHFIEVYLSVVDLLRDAEDIRLLTYEIARDMARQQVRYAELTVTPFSSHQPRHTRRGVPRGHRGRTPPRPRRSWASSPLDLRHPRRGRAARRRGDRPHRRRHGPRRA